MFVGQFAGVGKREEFRKRKKKITWKLCSISKKDKQNIN